MKIKELVALETINRGNERWQPVLNALPQLTEGMALPVEFEDTKSASSLQSFLLSRNKNGLRFSVRRIGTTVYVSKVFGSGAK